MSRISPRLRLLCAIAGAVACYLIGGSIAADIRADHPVDAAAIFLVALWSATWYIFLGVRGFVRSRREA